MHIEVLRVFYKKDKRVLRVTACTAAQFVDFSVDCEAKILSSSEFYILCL